MPLMTVTFHLGKKTETANTKDKDILTANEQVTKQTDSIQETTMKGIMALLNDTGALDGIEVVQQIGDSIIIKGHEERLEKLNDVLREEDYGRMSNQADAQDNDYYPFLDDDCQFFPIATYIERGDVKIDDE